MFLLQTLNNNCDRYIRLHLLFTWGVHRAGEAHREIPEICRTMDADSACELFFRHITDVGDYLKEFIKRRRQESQKLPVHLGKTVHGTTERDTGKAQIILPAWGGAELALSDASRQIEVPSYASMGARITQRVNLQGHLPVSMRPVDVKASPPFGNLPHDRRA